MIREFAPPAKVEAYVEAFWCSDAEPAKEPVRILPDGCADLVIDLNASTALVVGAMTRPLVVEDARNMFGVRFRPGRASMLLREPMSEFTDHRVPVRDLGILASRMSDVATLEQRTALLAEAMTHGIRVAEPEQRVVAAVDGIVRSGGRTSIEDLCDDIGVSRQHLARLFAEHVGMSPKTFSRVMRFRRALRLARGPERWTDLALELGYFDQSHLIADFREFAGDTPVPFFLSR